MFTGPPAAIAAATWASDSSGVVNASDAAQAAGACSCSARDDTGHVIRTSSHKQEIKRDIDC
jgi:hypothetical protein